MWRYFSLIKNILDVFCLSYSFFDDQWGLEEKLLFCRYRSPVNVCCLVKIYRTILQNKWIASCLVNQCIFILASCLIFLVYQSFSYFFLSTSKYVKLFLENHRFPLNRIRLHFGTVNIELVDRRPNLILAIINIKIWLV